MADYEIYKIVKGDNLTKIAKKYGTTVKELVDLNSIANPDLIYAGADLKIPNTATEIAKKLEVKEKAAAAAAKIKAQEVKEKAAEAAAKLKEKEEAAAKAAEEKKETLGDKIASVFKKDK